MDQLPLIKIIGERTASEREVPIKNIQAALDKNCWFVPEEIPVAFVFGQHTYATMLATPDDLVEFAVGFSLTERIVKAVGDIKAIEVIHVRAGIELRMKIADTCMQKLDVVAMRFGRIGITGCGICGLDNIDELAQTLPKITREKNVFSAVDILSAIQKLRDHQTLNRTTKSVHGAAWVDDRGNIVAVKEDVGRHNALDKLLGQCALKDVDFENGFVLLSSRCSYELVAKVAQFGIGLIVTLSGPTGFAIDKAREANITLMVQSCDGVVEVGG